MSFYTCMILCNFFFHIKLEVEFVLGPTGVYREWKARFIVDLIVLKISPYTLQTMEFCKGQCAVSYLWIICCSTVAVLSVFYLAFPVCCFCTQCPSKSMVNFVLHMINNVDSTCIHQTQTCAMVG